MKRSWMLLLSILLVSSIVQPVFAEPNVKELKIGITKDENTLTPYTYVTGYPGLDMVNLLYDNLFHLDEQNLPQPWLVKEFNVSDDGLTYEFTLHENVKWQDGQALTAEDVKFTVEYFLTNPKSRFTNPLKSIERVEVEDATHFTFVLSQANPNFMIQPLADLPILPKHIWSQVSNPDEATNALGSGPYILGEYKAGQYYKMTANEDYFKGKPVVETIIFPIIEDTTALYTALQAGEIDAISSSISPELVSQFESNSNLEVIRGPGYSTTLFQLNAEKYPMTEKAFRQAIAYAIDSKYLVDTVLLGYGELGSLGFIHPSSPFYNNQLSFTPDIEKAKQILEDSGFKDTDGDGFREDQQGNKLELTTLVYSSNPIRIRTAELITDWLNNAGLNVKVKAMDATTVDSLVWPDFDVSKGRDFDLAIWGWSSTMQLFPDRMVELFHSDTSVGSVNIGGYKNAEFDQLAESLRNTLDNEERKQIINEMQAFIADEVPITTLYYQEIVNAYNPNVYDGYVFQLGKGIFNKLSFVPLEGSVQEPVENKTNNANTNVSNSGSDSQQSEEATSNTEQQTEGNGSSTSIIILLILVVAILGGIFLLKRKTTYKDKDA